MNLAKAAATVGGFTIISRILGFVRDTMIASVLGASGVSDAFFVAFKLPNLFRRFFAEGAFNAAFVPLYSEWRTSRSASETQAMSNNIFSNLLVILILLVIVFELGMPWAVELMAPGFIDESEKMALAINLSRISFPYILFISIAAFFGGILNSIHKFSAAALSPAILNVCMILALLFAGVYSGFDSYLLSLGVFVAGIFQMIYLYYACKSNGVSIKFVIPKLTPEVKRLLWLGLPGAMSAGAIQINLFIGVRFASELPSGALSYLFYADRLYQLPLAVIGIAISTALLPQLSYQLKKEMFDAARKTQEKAIELSMLLTLPATAGLLYLAYPIIHVLFVRGEFSSADGDRTAATLIAYAAGLPAYVLVKIFNVQYFARQDTKTPFYMALAGVVINIGLNFALVGPMQYVGLALATSIAIWINAMLLLGVLINRGWFVSEAKSAIRLGLIVLSSVLMYYGGEFISAQVGSGILSEMTFVSLALNILICLVVYSVVILAFRIINVKEIMAAIR